MKITVKTNPKTHEIYIDLQDFASFINIKKVAYVNYTEENDTIILKFYDKNKKILKPKKSKI